MLANTNIADQPSTDSQRRLTQPKKVFSGLDTAQLRIAPLTETEHRIVAGLASIRARL
jgi:hypothetical protein